MSEARHHYPQQDQAHALWRCVALPLRCGLLLLLQLLAGCALPLRFRLVLDVCVFFCMWCLWSCVVVLCVCVCVFCVVVMMGAVFVFMGLCV